MATNLYEFYTGKGQALPSIQERAKLYEQKGLGSATGYTGTAQQNTALLEAISTAELQPAEQVKLPNAPQDTTNYEGFINEGNALLNNTGTATQTETQPPSWLQDYLNNIPKPENPAETYKTLEGQAGIEEKTADVVAKEQAVKSAQSELSMINAQLQGLSGELQTQNIQTQQEAGTMRGAALGQQANAREMAIRAIPLQTQALVKQAQIQGLQGNLETAQRTLEVANDRLLKSFQLQQDYEERQMQYKMKIFDAVMSWASTEQKNRLEDRRLQEQRTYEEKQNQIQREFQLKRDELSFERDKILKGMGATAGGGAEIVMPELPEGTPSEIKNSSTITNLIANSKIGQGTKTSLSAILGVINAAEDMAKANQLKGFKGISPLNRILDLKIPFTDISIVPYRETFKTKERIENEGYINAINLKVQQWASGAALTKQQTQQVERFTPNTKDSDNQVRTKLNNLVNFMNTQAKSNLQAEGISYEPEKVNLFEIYDLWKKASPEQKKEIETLINQ